VLAIFLDLAVADTTVNGLAKPSDVSRQAVSEYLRVLEETDGRVPRWDGAT
jgi:hypothetical protein